jgi:hypothetical protein
MTQLRPPRAVHCCPVGFGDPLMTQSKTSDELYSEKRRQHAAELIGAIVRKRRRITTDESLLDQEALRAAAERVARKEAGRTE